MQSYFVRGRAYLLAKMYQPAAEDFDAIIADADSRFQDGRRGEAHYNRGLVELALDSPKKAIQYFTDAIDLAPYLPEFYEARAEAYELIGNHRKAQQDRRQVQNRGARPPT